MQRILSGFRPTGHLHLGHLAGVMKELKYAEGEKFILIADMHTLTSSLIPHSTLTKNIHAAVKQLLAYGIKNAHYAVQSHIPQIKHIYFLISPFIKTSQLLSNPTLLELLGKKQTVKATLPPDTKRRIEQLLNTHDTREAKGKLLDLLYELIEEATTQYVENIASSFYSEVTHALFSYPVLQTADIVAFNPDTVITGEDQLPHLRIALSAIKKINSLKQLTPPLKLFKTSQYKVRLKGIDGRKMSKSFNNAIFLSDTDEQIEQKVKLYKTDTNRVRKTDKGNPNNCPLFTLHKAFNENADEIAHACLNAQITCTQCKQIAAQKIKQVVAPIREKAKLISTEEVEHFISSGNIKAQLVTQKTYETLELWLTEN